MSRSTLTFGQYELTGGTPVVETVCAFLLKTMRENPTKSNSINESIIKHIEHHLDVDYGFISVDLPSLKEGELNYLIDSISSSISLIESWGNYIPRSVLTKMQQSGLFIKNAEFTGDMPTNYVLDYFKQLKKMLALPVGSEISKEEETTTSYPIYKT